MLNIIGNREVAIIFSSFTFLWAVPSGGSKNLDYGMHYFTRVINKFDFSDCIFRVGFFRWSSLE
jgi:hypothetical protein